MKFIDKLIQSIEKTESHVCVGLDSRYDKLPAFIKTLSVTSSIVAFNTKVIEKTAAHAACFKMNVSFYAGFGYEGLKALALTNNYIHSHYPEKVILADCKRSEMGESVGMVRQELFDWLGFDCVMVTPWFGFDTARDYLLDESQGVCVYVHDSNPSAAEFQDLQLADGSYVYEEVAKRLHVWNTNGNVFAEAGATYPTQLARIRKIIGEDMVLLVAGIGPQGGKIDDLKGLFGKNHQRLLINSSRGIIYAGIGKDDYFAEVEKATMDLQKKLYLASLI